MPAAWMFQTSGIYEYYTPAPIVDAARETMGSIDLDPASSEIANSVVKAYLYYTKDQNGMQQDWFGNVWMNHPFGRAEAACLEDCAKDHSHHDTPNFGNAAWIRKLFEEWNAHNISAACCITYVATSEKWFRPLLDCPQCFLTTRLNYRQPDGSVKKGVQKGSVVTYLGDDVERFRRAFKHLGVVKV